jgi:DNA-nicking Smr family endonuclease
LSDNISNKDKKDWENFISSSDKLQNKDQVNKDKVYLKIKSVDLHGYTIEEANKFIEKFINESYLENVKKLIVITGKGLHSQNEKDPYLSKDLSILKYSVPDFIKGNQELMKKVIEIKDADIKDGGSGAFYIYLKKST